LALKLHCNFFQFDRKMRGLERILSTVKGATQRASRLMHKNPHFMYKYT
jgi:hypothetical protein